MRAQAVNDGDSFTRFPAKNVMRPTANRVDPAWKPRGSFRLPLSPKVIFPAS
jgi:hypothetical protein